MENKPAHANCEYFINVDGMPYCAVRDLYTEARADDKACADALIAELNKKKE